MIEKHVGSFQDTQATKESHCIKKWNHTLHLTPRDIQMPNTNSVTSVMAGHELYVTERN